MPLLLKIFFSLVISYVIGAIPTAYLMGRALRRVDIRNFGSGNVGATNAFRVLGKGPGIAVLLFDISKGVWAAALVPTLLGLTDIIWPTILGITAVAGHNWTIFLGFKGGKGIATSLGVLIGLTIVFPSIQPVVMSCVLIWQGVFLLSGYISLSSIIAAVSLPVFMTMTNQSMELIFLGIIFCVFVVIRHRPNLKRLLSGQEPKMPLSFLKR